MSRRQRAAAALQLGGALVAAFVVGWLARDCGAEAPPPIPPEEPPPACPPCPDAGVCAPDAGVPEEAPPSTGRPQRPRRGTGLPGLGDDDGPDRDAVRRWLRERSVALRRCADESPAGTATAEATVQVVVEEQGRLGEVTVQDAAGTLPSASRQCLEATVRVWTVPEELGVATGTPLVFTVRLGS